MRQSQESHQDGCHLSAMHAPCKTILAVIKHIYDITVEQSRAGSDRQAAARGVPRKSVEGEALGEHVHGRQGTLGPERNQS